MIIISLSEKRIKELYCLLEKDKITAEDVLKEISENNDKSWHSKEWRERRKEKLKDCCEQCGSKEILVIQHLKHPSKYRDIRYSIYGDYLRKYEEINNIDSIIPQNMVLEYINKIQYYEASTCPNCNFKGIRERKTITPKFICTKCKHEFNNLNIVKIPIYFDDRNKELDIELNKYHNYITYNSIKYRLFDNKARQYADEHVKEIEKKVVLTMLKENLDYIQMKDVVTFCKRCAFLYDIRQKDLCPKCKKKYKYRYMKLCNDCEEPNDNKRSLEELLEKLKNKN